MFGDGVVDVLRPAVFGDGVVDDVFRPILGDGVLRVVLELATDSLRAVLEDVVFEGL